KERLQRVSPNNGRRSPTHLSLRPADSTPLLRSAPEIRPRGAPRTHGDDVRTALSCAANLIPRRTSAAAARSAPESRRTAGGAPPPPPAGTRRTSRASPPSPRS